MVDDTGTISNAAPVIGLDEYMAEVEAFAEAYLARQDGGWELFVSGLMGVSAAADACVSFWATNMTDADAAGVRPLLETGLFPDPDPDRRLGWWLLCNDIVHRAAHLALERGCEPYQRNQPLFQAVPNLFARVRRRATDQGDLIDDRAVACLDNSEVYQVGSGFAKLSPYLPAGIANWARADFPAAPRFLRLEPSRFYSSRPLMRLEEAAIVPADPKWMKTLALFRGEKTFARYELLDRSPAEGLDEYREYRLGGLRRLEVTAERRETDYLSMMVEELPRADDPGGLMIGRCIHLDTRAPIGMPMAEARLQHLDLAINVYTHGDRALRFANTLQNGKAQNATFRTHLYRIEGVPFPALFTFAQMFLRSRVLCDEWIDAVLG